MTHSAAAVLAVLALAAIVVVGAITLGYWPGPSSDDPGSLPPRLVQPPASSGPGLALSPAAVPPVVLGPISSAPVSAAKLRSLLRDAVADRSLGPHLGLAVASLHSDTLLWKLGRPDTVTPASTLKLLTSLTALETMGPAHAFTTSVVAGRSLRRVVLVGGGDPLLTDDRPTPVQAQASYPLPASLEDLAAGTAKALRAEGVRAVTLGYDASLFSGPAVSPAWEPGYVPESVVSPITALWVDEGRAVAGGTQRVADPSAEAARRFAEQLTARGVAVRGGVRPQPARAGEDLIASVESAPLAEIVQHVLELSDNEGAEVLLRQAAIAAGRPGSFSGGTATVTTVLRGLGVELAGARILDGSGLSRDDAVPIEALVDVLQLAADPDRPKLRAVVSSLPVAGFTGSLEYRFVDDAPRGLGHVRAKTGTLTGVHGLAGIVTTAAGQVLVFAAVADRVPIRQTLDARSQLDVVAATLATCGCTRR